MWNKGQTMLELVVVVSVIMIVVTALTFATIASLRNSNFAQNQSQATKLAQEGMERVRVGRDRNQCINNMQSFSSVQSWNGNNQDPACNTVVSGSIWDFQIENNCVDCYFRVDNNGILTYITASTTFPQSQAEAIPPLPEKPLFRRAVILSDDAASGSQRKTVTVVVRWTDFSGDHESRLKTVLRNTITP